MGSKEGWGRILKPKQYARQSNEVKHKKQQSTQCRACDTIYISKYVNSFLSTNPTFFFFLFFFFGGGGGSEGGLWGGGGCQQRR